MPRNIGQRRVYEGTVGTASAARVNLCWVINGSVNLAFSKST